jgi:hypothetical protein
MEITFNQTVKNHITLATDEIAIELANATDAHHAAFINKFFEYLYNSYSEKKDFERNIWLIARKLNYLSRSSLKSFCKFIDEIEKEKAND